MKWAHHQKEISIQAQLNEQASEEQQTNLQCLSIIFSSGSIEYLATSERSFSSLHLLKTFLRTMMSQSSLNHLMLHYVHKDYTIDRKAAITEFIKSNSECKQTFAIPV